MKTKFKYLTFMAISLILGLFSCSSEDEAVDNSAETKSMLLKISNNVPTTYGEGMPAIDGSSVDFNSGDIYFVNASGLIMRHYTLTAGAASETNINLVAVQGGVTVENLPGSVIAVIVVGNYEEGDLATSGNISAVTEKLLAVESQSDIENVNLFGSSGLTPPVMGETKHTCVVNLSPTVARIELTDIKASGIITGFQIDGIFIDNYYSQAKINSILNASYLQDNGSDPTNFIGGSSLYPLTLTPSIYDFYDTGLSSVGNVVKLDDDEVWGYNVFASNTGSTIPRIIIRLSEIETDPSSGITISGPRFLTIRGFKSGSSSLTGIKSGEVYNIGADAFVFDEMDLTVNPNESKIEVEVTISLAQWRVIPITPEM